mgnify:CR=1 FL=1
MIVIDASLGLEMFLGGRDAIRVKDQIDAAGREMAVPEVFDLEIIQSLRRLAFKKQISADRAEQALDVARHAPLDRFSHSVMRDRIWSLRDNLSAYDAAYVALAEMLDAPLWTRDLKFTGVPGASAEVKRL